MPYYRHIQDNILRNIQIGPLQDGLKHCLYVLKAYRNGKTKYNQIMITELKLVVTSFGY